MRRLLLFLLVAGALAAADLARRVEQAIEISPAARAAFWGVQIDDLGTGRTLVSINAGRFFVPASNTKLFTTALGLMRLGADYRYETLVLAERAPDGAGTVAGDLRLVGGGDPNLSARAIPYRTGPIEGNALAAIEELAAQVVARGRAAGRRRHRRRRYRLHLGAFSGGLGGGRWHLGVRRGGQRAHGER